MAEIRRDVEIRKVEMAKNKLTIKGKNGGEMVIPLINPVENILVKERGLCPGENSSPLFIDCYRTNKIHSMDVSDYNGNKGEMIKAVVDNEFHEVINKLLVFIISPDKKLIEYGEMKQNKISGVDTLWFVYRTNIAHQFSEIKVVFCENLCPSES